MSCARVTQRMVDAAIERYLHVQALGRGMEMRSEITDKESRRAGQWEREAVERAERLAAVDRATRRRGDEAMR